MHVFDYNKIYNEVCNTLDDPDCYYIDAIVSYIRDRYYEIDSVDDIDSDEYWNIVLDHVKM